MLISTTRHFNDFGPPGCPGCPDHLDTIVMPRRAIATAPILTPAPDLVIVLLVHIDRSPPLNRPTLILPWPPTLGLDSHLECPSSPRVSTQQRTSGSSSCIHNRAKKPKPTIAAINSPATVAGATVTSRRPAAVRLLTAANQIPNVAGRKTKRSDERVEKLATNDSRPTPKSSPPRTPGSRTLEAISASTYGERKSRAKAT